jgi:hypothetical protein
MKYGDFSSLVQLGVGLHAGTALLQIYGDIGIQPFVRTLTRIRQLLEGTDPHVPAAEEFAQLESDFDIFRIQLFQEYRKYVVVNFAVAAVLMLLLVLIAYKADDPLSDVFSIFIVFGSIVPGPATVFILWCNASDQLAPLMARASALQAEALARSRGGSQADLPPVKEP